jgi:glycosyltransferase involved in cell wall biosynthesis
MATIIVLNVKVPFSLGGQDLLAHTLCKELKNRGHTADIIELPYSPFPKESLLTQAAMWRALDLTEFVGKKVDLVIATKFPSYFVKHPKKVLWLVHQHRPAYELHAGRFSDLSDDPRDEQLRRLLVDADTKAIAECVYASGISQNVVQRLKDFNNLNAEVIYPPLPLGNRYVAGKKSEAPFVLSVGRICSIKRIDLMIKALPIVHREIKLKIVGTPDEPHILDYLKNEISKHHLTERVEFLGRVEEQTLLELLSSALAVYYAPFNEDYGYVTLEGMASARPVITATDSGGTLEFIEHEKSGLIVAPTTDAIGHAVNRLYENKAFADELGRNGRSFIESSGLLHSGWDKVVNNLLSPLGNISVASAA